MGSSMRTKTRKKTRKAAKPGQALRQGDERLKSLLDLSSDWYWEQDEHHRFTQITGAALEKAGFDSQEYLGAARSNRDGLPAGDDGSWDKHRVTLEAKQPFTDFVFKRVNSRGELRYISTSGQPIVDEKKRFRGYRGTAKDVTPRVQVDLRLAIEHAVTRLLEESQSIAEAAPRIIRVVCETLEWACGARWEFDDRDEALHCAETWGVASAGIDAFLEATRRLAPSKQRGGLNRRTWAERKPQWIRDVTREATFRRAPAALKAGLHSAFAFPILVGEKAIGVMEFFSREIHQPDAELLNATRYIGSQIGQFMQRKHAEDVLRASEARFHSLTNLSSDWFWEQDAEFRFTRLEGRHVTGDDSAFASELGKTRGELGVEVEGGWEAHRALLEAHRPFRDVVMWRTSSDGRRYYMSISGAPMFDGEGRFIGYRGVGRDVTERRRAEQLLHLEHKVTRCLSEADSVSGALNLIIRAVCETEGWECGRYSQLDDKAGVMRFGVAWGVPNEAVERFIAGYRDVIFAPGVGLIGRVWQSGQPIWVSDLVKDTRVFQATLTREIGMHGAFVFPVISEGKTIGVLAFNSREVREPEERLMRAIGVIGSRSASSCSARRPSRRPCGSGGCLPRSAQPTTRSCTPSRPRSFTSRCATPPYTVENSPTPRSSLRKRATIGQERWPAPAGFRKIYGRRTSRLTRRSRKGADWSASRFARSGRASATTFSMTSARAPGTKSGVRRVAAPPPRCRLSRAVAASARCSSTTTS